MTDEPAPERPMSHDDLMVRHLLAKLVQAVGWAVIVGAATYLLLAALPKS